MRLRRRVAVGVAFALALVVAPLLCLRLSFARALVTAYVNRTLASTFVGRVVIDHIGEIGLTSVDDIDAHVDAPDGARVLRAEGLRARVSTWTLVRSLLGNGDVVVDSTEVSLSNVQATLDPDDRGTLRIARAFELRPSAPSGEEPRNVRLRLARVIVRHAAVHVHPKAAPDLDAYLEGAEASVVLQAGKVEVDLVRAPLVVRGLPGGVQAAGQIEAHITRPPLRVRAHWRGAVGAIRNEADVTYDDGRVDATFDVARSTPEQMRDVWPESPLLAETEAHAEAHGMLPRLEVIARAGLGAGTLEISGAVALGPPIDATLHIGGRSLDARSVLPSAASSELSASGDVFITAEPTGAIRGRGTLELAQGTWGSTRLPAATLRGEFARTEAGEPSARAELTVREAYAPTVVTAQLAQRTGQKGTSLGVTFDAQSTVARLEDIPALSAAALRGSANARATGKLDLATRTIDAQLAVTVDNLAARAMALGHAGVAAHASGKLDAPSFDVAVDGEGLDAGPLQLSALRGQAKLIVEQGATLRDVDVGVIGDETSARVSAALVRLSQDGLRVDDAVVEGLGAPLAATLHASPSAVVVKAKGAGIDLARLHSLVRTPIHRGLLSLDVDAAVSAGATEGHFATEVQHAGFLGVRDANARVDVVLHGRHAAGRAYGSVEDIGTFDLSTSSVDIGHGPLLTASPWRKTWGTVKFDAHVDLARLAARWPWREQPFAEMLGALDVTGRVSRDSADDATPGVDVTAQTTGLVLAGSRGGSAWRLEGLNPYIHATVDGNTGTTVLKARVEDAAGAIATLDASSNAVPYAILFSDTDPIEALRGTPFDAQLSVPSRPLDSLPPDLGLEAIGGDVQAGVSWHGTLVGPTVDLSAAITGSRVVSAVSTRTLDLSVGGHYDGARLDASLQAVTGGHKVLDAGARIETRAADLLAGLGGAVVPWKASVRAKLDGLPLQSIAALQDRQVRGKVSGEAVLDNLHEDGRGSVSLMVDGLKVGDVACRSSSIKLSTDGRSLDASARLDQDDGFVEGRARLGIHWGGTVTPSIDPSQPLEASLSAKQFRAAFLLPFVSRWLTELDGRIDANVRVATDGVGTAMRSEGTLALNDGAFELASFGGEFHGASARVTMTRDGLVRVEDAVARGLSGTVRAAATARIEGGSLLGVRATVLVPAKDPLPLVFDGVRLGVLDGAFDISADRAAGGHGVDMLVDAGTAHLQLSSDTSSVDVQGLGELEGVKVGVLHGSRGFVEVPLDGSHARFPEAGLNKEEVKVAVRLHDMQVSRGTDLQVRLEGQPIVVIGAETKVTGQIRMGRGSIDVYGKAFTIDRGTVTFVGDDPTNPQIVLTASWGAPDGVTRIYADFVGPLKTGKVRLRSEPAKPQSEILALVLFGTTDDQRNSPSATPAQVSPAAAVAGGAATQQINRALGGIDRALGNLGMAGGISTKIDTSQTTPRPEVEVQIARDISLQIAWVLGIPPSTNPDSTLVTLDWHFLRKWSLEATVGDMGTSILDVVWQHRY